jgi:hypothetical protein
VSTILIHDRVRHAIVTARIPHITMLKTEAAAVL